MSTNPRIKQFLDLSRLGSSGELYTIGPFFRNGASLLKQQVRAFNLVHSLAMSDPPLLRLGVRGAVIGGASPA